MKRRRALAGLGLLVSSCGLLACSDSKESDTNTETRPARPAMSACTLTGSQGSPECDACLEMNCCSELATCMSNPECNAVLSCMSTCVERPDPETCPGRCFGNGGIPAVFENVLECMIGRCELACTMRAG